MKTTTIKADNGTFDVCTACRGMGSYWRIEIWVNRKMKNGDSGYWRAHRSRDLENQKDTWEIFDRSKCDTCKGAGLIRRAN